MRIYALKVIGHPSLQVPGLLQVYVNHILVIREIKHIEGI